MWATDASYFRVVGWGYYYLVTVMDDYSRFILAHRLQKHMTSDSFIEAVQEAVDRTGMDQVPITDRTKLLSDNGPGYVSRAFRDYLGMVGIRHILAAPFHPQINGKVERYHQTLKRDVNQLPYELPSDLEAAIVAWGRMAIVDTKPFMLLVVQHRISAHTPRVTGTPAWPGGAGGYRRARYIP